MVEESAAVSESLRDQARNLDTLISQFVLPGDAPRNALPSAPRRDHSRDVPVSPRLRPAS